MNKKQHKGTEIFRNVTGGLFTLFAAAGAKPLEMWRVKIKYGYIERFLDPELKAMVLEIGGNVVSTSYITSPKNKNDTLGITLPYFIMVAKNLKKYFTFEVTVLDATGWKRRFRVANFQSTTQITGMSTVMPIGLADGWNQIQFNLADFTQRAYRTQFVKVLRVKVNANILLRRIYFTRKLMSDDELPNEYKLFFPISTKNKRFAEEKQKQADIENIQANIQQPAIIPTVIRESFEKRASIKPIEETKSKQTEQDVPGSRKQSINKEMEVKTDTSKTISTQQMAHQTSRVASSQAMLGKSIHDVEENNVVEGDKEETVNVNQDNVLEGDGEEALNVNPDNVVAEDTDNPLIAEQDTGLVEARVDDGALVEGNAEDVPVPISEPEE